MIRENIPSRFQSSQDGYQFRKVFSGANNLGSLDTETYKIEPTDARYIWLTVTKTSSEHGWSSIKELKVNGMIS